MLKKWLKNDEKEDFLTRYIKFVIVFFVIFSLTFLILYFTGLLPKSLLSNTPGEENIYLDNNSGEVYTKDGNLSTSDRLPTRVVISSIGTDFNIVNPESTDIDLLDASLKKGVVRYPTSGVGGQGSMFLFGHSSHLAVVNNKAYQAFNNIEKLIQGDEVKIYTAKGVFVYTVSSVTLMTASNALVDISGDKTQLTMTTCNNFGAKEDRYVVKANYKGFIEN